MRPVLIMAGREFRDGLRNRRVIGTTLLMAALSLTLALLGSAPTGTVGASALSVTVVSLSSLTIFLVPLIALLISYDAIAGEVDRGTMLLLLSYPVARWQILAGKFIGHLCILTLATILGYGAAGVAVGIASGAAEQGAAASFLMLLGSSVLLGATFIAFGYIISVVVWDPRTAAGVAIGVWLFFVVLYDMALLGLLIADQGKSVTPTVLSVMLLANPADIFRLLNLTGFSNISMLSGMAGLSAQAILGGTTLVIALVAWIVVPLSAAGLIFARRQI